MLAVCQPSVPCYAAACLMSADKHPCRPKTLTMMGGPIDTREAPTAVNTLATQRPHAWFEQNVIATVPINYPGAGRKVYPGFLQLAGFMTMNLGNHMISHWEMFKHLVQGDEDERRSDQGFLRGISLGLRHDRRILSADDRRGVPAPRAAQGRDDAPRRRVDPAAITDIALLAIEGERDDISGLGQTKAALTLATNLPDGEEEISGGRMSAITASSTAANGATNRARGRRLDRRARRLGVTATTV